MGSFSITLSDSEKVMTKVTRSTSEVTLLTCYQYQGFWPKWQAFRNMGLIPPLLKDTPNLLFYKTMGSGGSDGFGKWPNWGQYFLLTVWRDAESAQQYISQESTHPAILRLRTYRQSEWSLLLQPYKSVGQWDIQSPFQVLPLEANETSERGEILILTRAKIRLSKLWRFWRDVPQVSHSMLGIPGCHFSVGVGELPLIQQATLSIWESEQAMKNFAYRSSHHREVIKKTRQYQWYSEELFARFEIINRWGDLPVFLREL